MRARFAAVFVVIAACGGKNGPTKPGASRCVPASTDLFPTHMALTGTTLAFCLGVDKPSCFTADLVSKTIASASLPKDVSNDRRGRVLWAGNGSDPASASIERSAHGKGLTACTSDKATCHELPINAASIGDAPIAVSDDATLVAIDRRNPKDTKRAPGELETWDAVTGKKLASFAIHYGPTTNGYEMPTHIVEFVGHTVIAFTESACALPCSSAKMYSVHGKDLGMLAADPTGAAAEHFHDELYVLYWEPDRLFTVQDMATGKTVQPDKNASWDAIVTPEHIVRVVGSMQPRVEVWGLDLTRTTVIPIPTCAGSSPP